MQLYAGCAAEYRRRHDALWPELAAALTDAGIRDYRIFLNEAEHRLLAVMTLVDDHRVDALAALPVMKRWWAFMADLMATAPDDAPITTDLTSVFVFGNAGNDANPGQEARP